MNFGHFRFLPRNNDEAIPMDLLHALGIPMPDDALEQFPSDHGRNVWFHDQYAALDLHSIIWDEELFTAEQILDCSVYEEFLDKVDQFAEDARKVADEGWLGLYLQNDDILSWANDKTWRRSPILLDGSLIGSDKPYHLVEGHTRVGTLKGLVEGGTLSPDSKHWVWVGRPHETCDPEGQWKAPFLAARAPFRTWLFDCKTHGDDIGPVVDQLQAAGLAEESPEAVVAWAEGEDAMKPHMELLKQYRERWENAAES